MPSMEKHQSNEFTKMMLIGDSKAGKTGALASLVGAGYKLRILDFDNGLDILKTMVMKMCPDKLGSIEYRTVRDIRKAGPDGLTVQNPRAFVDAVKMLDKWKYKHGDEEIDYGVPAEWGPDCILVIDSFTFMCQAAFDWREPLVPRGKGGSFDVRAVYFDAQNAAEEVLATVTGENFRTNVIVISHVKYIKRPDGTEKGYPTAIGSALSPEIPRYFNTLSLFENDGGRRVLRTASTAMMDLANPKPFDAAPSYPIETGLAEFFAILRDPPKEPAKLRKVI